MEIDWKDIPLFCPNDYVLPKELDKETENTSLGALINLAYGEPSREEKIENWKEKGKQYFQNK